MNNYSQKGLFPTGSNYKIVNQVQQVAQWESWGE